MIYFKSNLKYLLKRLRVSQEEIASHVKVRSTTISNYVNGVSEPSVNELVMICHFFGISVDVFLFQNFEEGKVITDEDVQNFREKGKVIRKAIGKLLHQNSTNYQHSNAPSKGQNEGEENMLWAVLKTLRQMDGKIDVMRDGIEAIKNKKL